MSKHARADFAGDVAFQPDFLSAEEAEALFAVLHHGLDWRQHEIVLFGRRIRQPRLTAWYGDANIAYRYSGLALRATGWPSALLRLREALTARLGHAFNSVLCNLYRDGSDCMGWHADNERELGDAPLIASLSLGAPRRFVIRQRQDRTRCWEKLLTPGSLLVMRGNLQQVTQHAVPRTRRLVGPRINLTFRRILPSALSLHGVAGEKGQVFGSRTERLHAGQRFIT